VLGKAGDYPLTGDWNGDRRDKAAVFREGLWLVDYDGDGTRGGQKQYRVSNLGGPGDIPLSGDWNGDGRSKIGVFRDGLWLLDHNGNGVWDGPQGGDRALNVGAKGSVPLVMNRGLR
jgi:hypothetical protein